MVRKVPPLFWWIAAGAGAYLLVLLVLLACLRREESTPVRVESVSTERDGNDLLLHIKGSGFDRQTRLSLSLDIGNAKDLLADIPTWGVLHSIALDGTLAYLANGYRGVQVLDLADPLRPKLIGSLRTPGIAWKITLAGGLAYLAAKEGGVQVIDISDPRDLRIIGAVETGGVALDIVVAGNRAYVANVRIGLQVIDLTDPSHPHLLGAMGGAAYALAAKDEHLLVLNPRGSLTVFAVQGGGLPRLVSTLMLPSPAFGLALNGDWLYVAAGRGGLQVIDLRDPRQPRLGGTTAIPALVHGVTVAGGRAFLTQSSSGLAALDLGQPQQPRLLGSFNTPWPALSVVAAGTVAYVSCGRRGLALVDIRRPALPPAAVTRLLATHLLKVKDRLYAIDASEMTAIDISDPARSVRQSVPRFQNALMALSGDRAYLRQDEVDGPGYYLGGGIHMVDVRDPRRPKAIFFQPVSKICSLAARNDLVFAGSMDGKILIFEAAPAQLRQIGEFRMTGPVFSLLADGDFLYVGNPQEGLVVLDIERPREPRLIGATKLPWHLQANSRLNWMEKSGNVLLVADGPNGLLVYDLTNPRRPSLLSSVPVRGYAREIHGSGHMVWLVDMRKSLIQIDLRKPHRPQIVSVMQEPRISAAVLVKGWLYLFTTEELFEVPVPLEPRQALARGTQLTAVFPLPGPGTYSLHLSNGIRSTLIPAAVTVPED